eukprot:PhF_6_TR14898/c0_g1_i2/m.23239
MSYYDFLQNSYGNPQYTYVVKSCALISLTSDLTPIELPFDIIMSMLDLYIPPFRLTNVVPEGLKRLGSGIGCSTDLRMNVDANNMVARGVPGGTNHVVFINPGIHVGSLRASRDGYISIPFRVTAFDYESVYIVKQGVDEIVTNMSFRAGEECREPDTPMVVDIDAEKATLRKVGRIISETKHPWPLTDDDVLIVGFYLYKDACVLRMGHEDK